MSVPLLGIARGILGHVSKVITRCVSMLVNQPTLLWPLDETLPIAGLDAKTVQELLFALQHSVPSPQDAPVPQLWLRTVQLAQICSDRLLHDLHYVERNLAFWEQQMAAGGHLAFMLLGRGPLAFAHDLARVLQLSHPADQVQGQHSATDKMQHRVLLLKALRSRLAEALARLQGIAGTLRLEGTPAGAGAQQQQGFAASPFSRELAGAPLLKVARVCSELAAHSLVQLLQEVQQEVTAVMAYARSAHLQQATSVQQLTGSVSLRRTDTLLLRQHSTLPQVSEDDGPEAQPAAAADRRIARTADLVRLKHRLDELQAALNLHPACSHLLEPVWVPTGSGSSRAAPQGEPATHQPAALYAPQASARSALMAARRAAAMSGPLVIIPPWARRPSRFQRNWLKYTLAWGLGLYSASFVVRHSRLAGSNDLDRWALQAASTVQDLFQDHVVSPLLAVRDELFRTFRDRPSIVSTAEFEADKASLLRMLEDFKADKDRRVPGAAAAPLALPSATLQAPAAPAAWASSASGAGAAVAVSPAEQDALVSGMSLLMESYEKELKSPIKNLVTGELARSMLIQVQRLKVDTEAAMLELDQILRANELSISLVAAVPALAISWATLTAVVRSLRPRAPDVKREAVPCRLAMAELERALVALETAQEKRGLQLLGAASEGEGWAAQQQQRPGLGARAGGGEQAAALNAELQELQGLCIYRLYRVYREAHLLFQRKDRTSRYSEWPSLDADLALLARPASCAQHLATHARMMRTYKVFQR